MKSPYDADYYLNGPKTGKSNYENYSWKPKLTIPMAQSVRDTFGTYFSDDTLLDVGCARGYLVKALRSMGVNAFGYDTSEWAIANCDPDVKEFVSTHFPTDDFSHIFCKDVMEHIPEPELVTLVDQLLKQCLVSMLVIVPLSFVVGGDYVRKEDNMDSTHVIKWPLESWIDFFQNRAGRKFTVNGSWHIEGLKPTSFTHLKSCGFITLQRLFQG